MIGIVELFRDFSHLGFPFNCFGCNRALQIDETLICNECIDHIPRTRYWEQLDNDVEKIFWGRTNINRACAYMFFNKDGIAQRLLHSLKYEGKSEVGYKLGQLFATELLDTTYEKVDLIIPVPLHFLKKKKRGYNQCDFIVAGMASVFGCSYAVGAIERIRFNETQTKKGRYERWINVQELFRVTNPELIKGKSILLVDDVVTTGSTLEACAEALLDVEDVEIKIATIACPSPF